jgi:hypothetical protein
MRYERVAASQRIGPRAFVGVWGALHAEVTRRRGEADRTAGGRGPEGVSLGIEPAFLQEQTSA